MPAEVWVMFILCLQQTLCCSHACQNKYQLFVSLKCILFKSILRFTRICCKEFSQLPIYRKEVLNAPKVFRFPHSQRSRRLRSGDRAGQLTGAPRSLHSAAYVWFVCWHAEKESYRPTIRVSFLSSLTERLIIPGYRQIIKKNRWYTAPVSLLWSEELVCLDDFRLKRPTVTL